LGYNRLGIAGPERSHTHPPPHGPMNLIAALVLPISNTRTDRAKPYDLRRVISPMATNVKKKGTPRRPELRQNSGHQLGAR